MTSTAAQIKKKEKSEQNEKNETVKEEVSFFIKRRYMKFFIK